MKDKAVIEIPSPNFDQRPPGIEIDLVVIHAISLPPGEFGGGWVAKFFTNQLPLAAHPYFAGIVELKVSSHYFIERDGGLIRFVAEDKRAWHAGVSCYEGRENCNDFSLGVELEGDDSHPFSDHQYATLQSLLAGFYQRHPGLDPDRIVAHSEIAPGRKTDPGPFFAWSRIGCPPRPRTTGNDK